RMREGAQMVAAVAITVEAEQQQQAWHSVHSRRYRLPPIAYRAMHYHCCACRRVFRSARAPLRRTRKRERRGRRPAEDEVLRCLGLVQNAGGMWMRQGTYPRTSASTPRTSAEAGTG